MNLKKIIRETFAETEGTTKAQMVKNWLLLIAGSMLIALGFTVFINPYRLVPGGVYGLSLVLHNLFPTVQVGTFGYILGVPLLILSWTLLGGKFGARTMVSALITPLFMNVIDTFGYPSEEAMRSLDPTLLFGGVVDMSQHLMLTTLMGAVLVGVGAGLTVRSGATSGGTDVISMIIQKYFRIPFSNATLMVDGTVVLIGLVVFGFGLGMDHQLAHPSWHLSFYSLVACFVIASTISFVLSGQASNKLVYVIGSSAESCDRLHGYILHTLDRGATIIKAKGLYSGLEREMIFIVVTRREVMPLKQMITMADPGAFVVITDAYDIYGQGFKRLPAEGDINPE